MAITEVTLVELECLKGNEAEDEIYFITKVVYDDAHASVMDRYPTGDPENLKMKAGEKVSNIQLYVGDAGPSTITIDIKEQDAKGLLSAMTGLDDTIGTVEFRIDENKNIVGGARKTAKVLSGHSGDYTYDLTGGNSHYKAVFKIRTS